MEDLDLPCLKPLIPVGLDGADAIRCLTPWGIRWIRPGDDGGYALSNAVKGAFPGVPVHYIGRTDEGVYLRSNLHLLVFLPR